MKAIINQKVSIKRGILTISKTTNLDSSKLKEFAHNYFEFDENSRKFPKRVENNVANIGMSNFSFFHIIFKKTCTADM